MPDQVPSDSSEPHPPSSGFITLYLDTDKQLSPSSVACVDLAVIRLREVVLMQCLHTSSECSHVKLRVSANKRSTVPMAPETSSMLPSGRYDITTWGDQATPPTTSNGARGNLQQRPPSSYNDQSLLCNLRWPPANQSPAEPWRGKLKHIIPQVCLLLVMNGWLFFTLLAYM